MSEETGIIDINKRMIHIGDTVRTVSKIKGRGPITGIAEKQGIMYDGVHSNGTIGKILFLYGDQSDGFKLKIIK